MSNRSWPLQDAKARFSALVDAAMRGEAQHVTKRGRAAVVVISSKEFERLRYAERGAAPGFIEHLIAVPKPTKAKKVSPEPRPALRLREADFS